MWTAGKQIGTLALRRQLLTGYGVTLHSVGVEPAHSHFSGGDIRTGENKAHIYPKVRIMLKPGHLDSQPVLSHWILNPDPALCC